MMCMRKECNKKTSVVKNFNKAEPRENCMFVFTHICKRAITFKGCRVPYADNGKIYLCARSQRTGFEACLYLVSSALICPYLHNVNAPVCQKCQTGVPLNTAVIFILCSCVTFSNYGQLLPPCLPSEGFTLSHNWRKIQRGAGGEISWSC